MNVGAPLGAIVLDKGLKTKDKRLKRINSLLFRPLSRVFHLSSKQSRRAALLRKKQFLLMTL